MAKLIELDNLTKEYKLEHDKRMDMYPSTLKFKGTSGDETVPLELLFDDEEIVERIKEHPMALWKCQQ